MRDSVVANDSMLSYAAESLNLFQIVKKGCFESWMIDKSPRFAHTRKTQQMDRVRNDECNALGLVLSVLVVAQ